MVSPFLTTPSALSKELRDIFLMRSHPSSPRRGLQNGDPGFHRITDEDCGTVLVNRIEENEYGHKISMQMPVLQKLPVRTGGMFLQVRRQPSQVQLHMQVLQVTIGRAHY